VQGFSVDEVAEVRLLIRILVLRWIAANSANVEEKEDGKKGEGSATSRSAVETSFAHFLELMSNKHSFGSAAINRFRQRAFLVMEALSGRATSDVLQGLDVDEIVEYIGRLESNMFARYSTTKRKTVNYGSALYNCAAMFNHSCFPSVVRQFDGQHLTLRALRPLNPGDELTMTYIPLRDGTPERQDELQQYYHFACRCQRCASSGARLPCRRQVTHAVMGVRVVSCHRCACRASDVRLVEQRWNATWRLVCCAPTTSASATGCSCVWTTMAMALAAAKTAKPKWGQLHAGSTVWRAASRATSTRAD
jgi:hypothetical protein